MNRPLVIYHADCADGFTAAWVAHLYYTKRGIDPELVAARYGDAPPDVAGRDVLIVDFSYPREVLVRMHEEARALLVLDHHKTAREALEGLPFAFFDEGRSGAMLAWDYFFSDRPEGFRVPDLVRYVQDRDLWRWELPQSREINAALGSLDFDLERWTDLAGVGLEGLIEGGRAILRYQERVLRRQLARARTCDFLGHRAPVVNATALVSELGNALAVEHPFAVVWFEVEGGYVYSLRSSASNPAHVDVSQLAREHGGGGHRHAAGFKSAHLIHAPAGGGGEESAA